MLKTLIDFDCAQLKNAFTYFFIFGQTMISAQCQGEWQSCLQWFINPTRPARKVSGEGLWERRKEC